MTRMLSLLIFVYNQSNHVKKSKLISYTQGLVHMYIISLDVMQNFDRDNLYTGDITRTLMFIFTILDACIITNWKYSSFEFSQEYLFITSRRQN